MLRRILSPYSLDAGGFPPGVATKISPRLRPAAFNEDLRDKTEASEEEAHVQRPWGGKNLDRWRKTRKDRWLRAGREEP